MLCCSIATISVRAPVASLRGHVNCPGTPCSFCLYGARDKHLSGETGPSMGLRDLIGYGGEHKKATTTTFAPRRPVSRGRAAAVPIERKNAAPPGRSLFASILKPSEFHVRGKSLVRFSALSSRNFIASMSREVRV